MNLGVSKPSLETQGREGTLEAGEKKTLIKHSESMAYTETYRAMLARELLINNFQQDHCKYF